MNEEKAKRIVRAGTDIAGGAIGGALGFLAAGPAGAAMAGATGVAIAEVAYSLLGDFAARRLSRAEEARVGATAAFALASIKARLEAGDIPRSDGFFTEIRSGQTDAEQIFEGVLLRAKNEHQQKKVRFLGEFYANLAFSPDVSVSEANHMLRIAESLSYRQLSFLALLEEQEIIPSIPLVADELEDPALEKHPELASLIQEIYDMAHLGLIFRLTDELRGTSLSPNERYVTPHSMRLTPLGLRLAGMLKLQSMDTKDMARVADLLHL